MGMSGVNISFKGTANSGCNSVLMMTLFVPRLTLETVTVTFFPTSPRQQALNCYHNPPTANIKGQKRPFHTFTTGGILC